MKQYFYSCKRWLIVGAVGIIFFGSIVPMCLARFVPIEDVNFNDVQGEFISPYSIFNDKGTISFVGISGGVQLTYDVPTDGSYAGLNVNLPVLIGSSFDMSQYKTISFQVRGDQANLPMKIEMKNTSNPDSGRNSASMYVTDYLDGGITTSFRTVTIPLDGFANLDNLNTITQLVFIVEHDYAAHVGVPTNGVIDIRNISFGTTTAAAVRIDHFGDNWGWLAIGGNIGSIPNAVVGLDAYHVASFASGSADFHNYRYALQSTYNVNNDPYWSGFFMACGGGADGWTAQPCDFSNYNTFSFYVKAQSAAENPRIFKLEIKSGTGVTVFRYILVTESWQYYTLDLNAIAGLEKNTIEQINVIYEKDRIETEGGSVSGVILFDEMQFEQ